MVAGDVINRCTHLIRVDIEGRGDAQLEALAVEILRDRLAEVTHADDCHIHGLLTVEDAVNEVDEYLHIVALLRIAREAYEHKVAAHLHSRDAVHTCQDMREDVCDTLGVTLHERAAVLAQALDGLLRYRRGYIVICHVKVCFRSTRQLSSSRGGSADAPSWY